MRRRGEDQIVFKLSCLKNCTSYSYINLVSVGSNVQISWIGRYFGKGTEQLPYCMTAFQRQLVFPPPVQRSKDLVAKDNTGGFC